MTAIPPRAGQLPRAEQLVDLAKLVDAYHDVRPDPAIRAQRVAFDTSGQRGASLDAGCLARIQRMPHQQARHVSTQNDLDCLYLVQDVVDRLPHLGPKAACLKQLMQDKRIEHKRYIGKHGKDLPQIRTWKWKASAAESDRRP